MGTPNKSLKKSTSSQNLKSNQLFTPRIGNSKPLNEGTPAPEEAEEPEEQPDGEDLRMSA